MPLTIDSTKLSSVAIIDDNESSRSSALYALEDLKLQPKPLDRGPIEGLADFMDGLARVADAVYCDYHLKRPDYSAVDGDEIVAECYRRRIPAILCTAYTDWAETVSRKNRRFLPVIYVSTIDEIGPELVLDGFERCIREFDGKFASNRIASRAMIRVAEVDKSLSHFYVLIPGWSSTKRVRVPMEEVPLALRQSVAEDALLHAKVNVGALDPEDIYIDEWETP